ncbi:hypothetical protein K1719_044166 [Acacia pycnantha]|nr:hypothetical protein K1719_044166 [Acacia pycnantha]
MLFKRFPAFWASRSYASVLDKTDVVAALFSVKMMDKPPSIAIVTFLRSKPPLHWKSITPRESSAYAQSYIYDTENEISNRMSTKKVELNQLILQELNYDKQKERVESERLQRLMTNEQKQVFDEIICAISSKKGGFFFLHGFGGIGKTFIWNALTASVRSTGGIILNVASSGIAATLLPSGELHIQEYLNAIKCSYPHHKLVLKVGVPVMLIRNIDQAAGMCNGTRLQISQLGKNVIKAKALNGTSIGKEILIHRMDMNPSETKLPFNMTRRQFPIIISFAMTINKSQGQSMTNVGLYLPSPVFSHGQLYVALSRVKNFNGLKILIPNEFKNARTQH